MARKAWHSRVDYITVVGKQREGTLCYLASSHLAPAYLCSSYSGFLSQLILSRNGLTNATNLALLVFQLLLSPQLTIMFHDHKYLSPILLDVLTFCCIFLCMCSFKKKKIKFNFYTHPLFHSILNSPHHTHKGNYYYEVDHKPYDSVDTHDSVYNDLVRIQALPK